MARTGRRPGNQDTREAILAAAREAFAERGFDAASIRAIAGERRGRPGAGAPLLRHQGPAVPGDACRRRSNPAEVIPKVLQPADSDGVGERLVRIVAHRLGLAGRRGGGRHGAQRRQQRVVGPMLREFVVTQILRRAVKELDLDPAEAPTAASLVATQMAGLVNDPLHRQDRADWPAAGRRRGRALHRPDRAALPDRSARLGPVSSGGRSEAEAKRRSGKAPFRPDTGVVSGRNGNAAGRRLDPPQPGHPRRDRT